MHFNFFWHYDAFFCNVRVTANRPPVPGFSYTPTLLFEGDTEVNDPDGDTLTVRYKVTLPNGNVQYYPSASTNYTITSSQYNSEGPSWTVVPGRYTIEQTVSDGKAAPVTLTRSFNVSELGIKGYVTHTEEWEKNRLSYNEKYPRAQRDALTFWAGERFILDADTTDTGSS